MTIAATARLLPLAAVFVLVVAIVSGRAILFERQSATYESVRTAFQFEQRISAIQSLLQDAEAGQRGYILTGEQLYRQPYEAAVAALPEEFARTRTSASAEPDQLARLGRVEELVSERLVMLREVLALHDRGDGDAAIASMRTGRGPELMDHIDSEIGAMLRQEAAQLEAQLAEVEKLARWQRYFSAAAGSAILVLGIFGVLDLRSRLRALAAAHDELAAANATLKCEMASREAAETQVRQMQKMEAIGQLTGGVAHDFNNMLAVVMSALNLMQRKLARGETDVARYVDAAADAVGRAANLTARLLAFSRQQPLTLVSVDANRLISDMADLMRRTLGPEIAIETVLAGGLWRTRADATQLENAVLNLAVNARDAMPGGGHLTIESANAYLDDDYARRHTEVRAGQYVMIAVSDTGGGMAPDVAARAFDPFFTTKPAGKGTGLGLSQVYGFIKQSGGHVNIYSEPGQGTTVKIYLPRHFGEQEEPTEKRALSDPGRPPEPREKVLVVEDDPLVRTGTLEAMRELGYSVLAAEGGEEALRRLDAEPDVALLFTDIVMPGMNGRKLADEALARRPGLKVLFTTGFTRNAVVHNGVLDPGVHFIAKPFTVDQLGLKLREVFDDRFAASAGGGDESTL
jgi:signal transduction histidine kinase/ActR/RegA family two-component response regulator